MKDFVPYTETKGKSVAELAAMSKVYFRNELAEFVYYRTYSRWMDDSGRRETWIETVERFMNYMKYKLGDKIPTKDYNDIHEAILEQKIVPSMRLLWGSGKAVESTNVAAYNCSFIAPTKIRDFGEIMYILMCGTGVGFSVEEQTVNALPLIEKQTGKKLDKYVVSDSKEGWADAFIAGLEAWFSGSDMEFDYSKLRPEGARLNTMGGRSSGPKPLINLIEFARERILSKQNSKLSTLDVHDICCKIGEVVVSGGVRRSAMISLSDLGDESMRFAKAGEFWNTDPQRFMANNSAVYNTKPLAAEFLSEWVSLVRSGTGERGIFNRGSLNKQLPKRRWEKFKDYANTCGTNPCGEIILRNRQFCNLTSIVAREDDTIDTLKEKIRLATILGTYQASLTDFKYLSSEWKLNSEAEALLGVSITGVWDCPQIRDAKVLRTLRDLSIDVNEKYAKKLNINASTCITCIKPSGNSSQLLDTSSGLHPRHAKYYIRRVRISKTDPLFQMMVKQGVAFNPEVGQTLEDAHTLVLDFPVAAPDGVYKDNLSALEQLENWKLFKENFTEHNPSVTVSISDSEWVETANWIYDNWDIIGGLSFLPREDHIYKLAPYETIDEKTYKQLESKFPKIDYSKILEYEMEDETQGAKELACVSGACEI